jgi:DNA segregation ATPase FtsK/SpoIIIE-like protein
MWFLRKKRHPLELAAEHTANVIQHQLTRLNLAHRAKRGDVEVIQRVEFTEPLTASPDEIRIEVDVSRLPRGIHITDLRKPEVLETLSVACKMPVRAEYQRGRGFWLVVEIEERSGIPKLVKYSEMSLPPGAPALMLPIGMGRNNKQQWEDLRDLPHLLIAGATKRGKSVLVNTILCSLAGRLGPDRLHLHLCDLKGGMELSFYEPLPHVREFIDRAELLPQMLADIQTELERRTALLKGTSRDIDGYNHQVGQDQALPYKIVVLDEIANAMLNKDKLTLESGRKGTISGITESILADLAARARAVGIHLIISTQRPSVDVVTGLIKANFPCRIAFGTASEIDSRVIVDEGSAHGLAPGRMQFRRNMELLELQAPLITDSEVRRLVVKYASGTPEPQPESTEDRSRRQIAILLDVADQSYGGKFPIRELAQHATVVKNKISRTAIEAHAARLEAEGILRKQLGPRPRALNVDRNHWEAKYPPSVLRPVSVETRELAPPHGAGDLRLVESPAQARTRRASTEKV